MEKELIECLKELTNHIQGVMDGKVVLMIPMGLSVRIGEVLHKIDEREQTADTKPGELRLAGVMPAVCEINADHEICAIWEKLGGDCKGCTHLKQTAV